MQSMRVDGLNELLERFEDAPGIIRKARAEVFEDLGGELLDDLQARIGGSGRVAGVQEYQVGSGKGYVAVRAKKDTELDGYAAGYVTNALENGHRQEPGRYVPSLGAKLRRDLVPGKYMYQRSAVSVNAAAAEGAQRLENLILKALEGS